MRHSLRPDHAAEPRLLDGVDAGLDRDLVSEMITISTIRARRSSTGKVGHAGYSNLLGIAQWLQSYLLAGAALGRLSHSPLSKTPCTPFDFLELVGR